MRAILSFIRKEFLQLRRDRRMLPIIFVAPMVQLLLLGYAVDLDVRDVPVVVCDLDRTAASREFLASYFHSGYFTEKGRAETPDDVDRFLDHGLASMAFIIPRGFGDDLAAGRTARVQLIADGAESQSATVGLNYASLIAARFSERVLAEAFEKVKALGLRPVRLRTEVRVWYNPELRSRYFLVPGILGLVLMVMTLMLTSMAVVREKEMGTLEQLIVTPLRARELILGKLLPFVAIGLIDVVLVVGVATLLIRVPLRGSILLLLGLALLHADDPGSRPLRLDDLPQSAAGHVDGRLLHDSHDSLKRVRFPDREHAACLPGRDLRYSHPLFLHRYPGPLPQGRGLR
jgi:ABC-2 type transport system permease protein